MTRGTRGKRLPKYRYHAVSGQGFVEIDRRRIYLGPYDNLETREKYQATVAEWVANGYRRPADPKGVTVETLCEAYWRYAQTYYVRPDGSPTKSLDSVLQSLKPMRVMYGSIRAPEFGPKALRAIQEHWVKRGLSRRTVNYYSGQIKRMYKWGVSRELVDASVYHALTTVEGLRAGRTEARDSEPVRPVPIDHIEAVRQYLSRQVNALVSLQLLTGARPGELIALRATDIDMKNDVWTVTLTKHKMVYRGRPRTLYFGPKAKQIVMEFAIGRPVGAYLFSPKEAEADRCAEAATHRRCGQPQTPRKTRRTLGDHYTVASYRRSVSRACDKAGIPIWTPHRLRHNAATEVRNQYGLDAAQVILGHSTADVTQIYAEADQKRAIEVARERG